MRENTCGLVPVACGYAYPCAGKQSTGRTLDGYQAVDCPVVNTFITILLRDTGLTNQVAESGKTAFGTARTQISAEILGWTNLRDDSVKMADYRSIGWAAFARLRCQLQVSTTAGRKSQRSHSEQQE